MVNEAGKVAHVALVDLVGTVTRSTGHDIQAFNTESDQADEFGNGCAALVVLWFPLADGCHVQERVT